MFVLTIDNTNSSSIRLYQQLATCDVNNKKMFSFMRDFPWDAFWNGTVNCQIHVPGQIIVPAWAILEI